MDSFKIKNKLLICLCIFVLILPFYLITFTYATEDSGVVVDGTQLDGLSCSDDRNYFFSNPSGYITYYPVKKGFIYSITQISSANGRSSVYSSSFPEANVTYDLIYTFVGIEDDGYTFEYLCTTDGYIALNGITSSSFSVTERPANGQINAVSSLVDNVGISQIWDIFGISINYIVVVVLFVFGCYIIFKIIKKVSRGKEGL